ncbi:RNA polymerase sigma factor [Micromonospora sp. DR5-3]|uniref:RNA polymerase sigma factor n=1 Tax=unclassified Micromonospora TaxID=2617518 RepID=UPI0011D384C0|nr:MULTISPECIES: RNA polymerase sigma factor [unclassified Micromonospora]MCW3817730.1 RNA polymerase sigma factor [Micromonospora sp. DR5-3]TYC20038.1 RNA polymerase sigma factor [Micromonospora sp. MP36]
MMDVGDGELLRLIGEGDRRAFDVLYARNAPWLVLRLRRRCRDPELVREVLQETFLTVWRAAASYRGDGAVVGWLWAVAVRRLIDARRRALARPQSVGSPGEEILAWSPSAEEEVMAGAYDADLERALHRLAPELRAVLQATVLDGLSVREAAVLLGLPEGTVKTRAMRARRELREALS